MKQYIYLDRTIERNLQKTRLGPYVLFAGICHRRQPGMFGKTQRENPWNVIL